MQGQERYKAKNADSRPLGKETDFSQEPQKGQGPANTLSLACGDLFWTFEWTVSDMIINLCFYKPLSLW